MRWSFSIRGIVFSALFAALLVGLSFLQVSLGFTPVPITLANMGAMLAGVFLGAYYGFFSIALVVVLTAIGLPLLDGAGGLGQILGPNGGYIVMWPFDALFVGWLSSKSNGSDAISYLKLFLVVEIFGSLLCYPLGVAWLAHSVHISTAKALVLGCYPYLFGDALKALLTTLVAIPVRRLYPSRTYLESGGAKVVRLSEDEVAQT
jgi:biotin transport system substrate-specific component